MAHPSADSYPIDGILWYTDLDDNDSTQKESQLGIRRREYSPTTGGVQEYIYVKNNSASAIADGSFVHFNSYASKVAVAHASAAPAGAGIGTITGSYYGWIQVKGYHDAILCSSGGAIAAGGQLIPSATNGKVCAVSVGGASVTAVGWATAADSTTSVAGVLNL